MAWTLDSYRGQPQARAPELSERWNTDPLSDFCWRVDLMLYIAAGAFAACVIALLVG